MEEVIFLTTKEIKKMQKGLIEAYGGLHGIHDEKLLESAINTPKITFNRNYLHTDIFEMASAYAYHIIKMTMLIL